jgi:Protein of unknown function (DUF3618)
MTASHGAGTPAKQPADAAEASGSELSPQATVNAGTQETAPLTGRVAAPPNDLHKLEAEIERTRQQLGETVRELVARTDVKSLARAKAAELTGRVKDTTSQARRTAAAGAAARKDQLRNRAAPVWQATPEQVRQAVTNGANGAKGRWIPLTVAAGALIVGCLAFRQWRRSLGAGTGK